MSALMVSRGSSVGSSTLLKGYLILGSVVLVVALLFYTQGVVNRLKDDVSRISQTYAKLMALATSQATGEELNIVFEEVITKSDFPIIVTDSMGRPQAWKGVGIAWDDTGHVARERLVELVSKMRAQRDPIPLRIEEVGRVFGYLHYGDSELVRQLRWMPIVQVVVVGLFLIIGFIGFRNIKRSEQRSIWVGLAKETAHQLGTPISSLLGWLELLRTRIGSSSSNASPSVEEIAVEMEGDVNRLSKIASRFGQIGSPPELGQVDVVPVLRETAHYFRARLPRGGADVQIEEDYGHVEAVEANRELLAWVVENLVRNSLDAMAWKRGRIVLSAGMEGEMVTISVADTGKGIHPRRQRRLFSPGFTTKKKGWGLGLTLAKRIVEEYHGGRLQLVESRPWERTVFRISLPALKKVER